MYIKAESVVACHGLKVLNTTLVIRINSTLPDLCTQVKTLRPVRDLEPVINPLATATVFVPDYREKAIVHLLRTLFFISTVYSAGICFMEYRIARHAMRNHRPPWRITAIRTRTMPRASVMQYSAAGINFDWT